MADLNVMLREQAINGLQATLDKAVTAGDTEAARKAADDLAKLAVSTAPATPAFISADVWKLAETKAAWLGVDPKKSAKANEFALAMNLKRFPSAEAAADAIIKAVEDEFKPAIDPKDPEEDEDEEDEDGDEAAKEAAAAARKAKRRTDGPGEGDANQRSVARRSSGPWTKLADAPADIQKEVKRQADKFVAASATKEQREKFIASALGGHYAAHQRKAGKK
jgi:hypothetical protein